tara:strand:+ start:4394 stop:5230 length:837 start_codon:yes stop_codon:yes gene_type:complete
MPSLKEIRNKISSVKSTKRIMQAMKMIATVKYAKTQVMISSFRPYYDAYRKIISTVSKMSTKNGEKYLKQKEGSNDLLILISSDRGLCGSYNSNLFRKVEKSEKIYNANIFIGKKGKDYFKHSSMLDEDFSFSEKNFKEVSKNLSPRILEKYLNNEIDNVYVGYNKFISAITQEPTVMRALPFQIDDLSDESSADVLIEPDVESFIDIVFPQFFNLIISSILLDSITSEHAARTAAMDNATRNADDIIRETTKLFNKTRQASITTELMDIVNGAEAVK